MRFLRAVAIAFFICVPSAMTSESEAAIQKVLDAQVQAWNEGDLRNFVLSYSDDCTFVGATVLKGRAALLERYQNRYPTKAAMGTLKFSQLVVQSLNENVAMAYGKWQLERDRSAGGPVGGVFSLVLQLRKGVWEIVLDHTA